MDAAIAIVGPDAIPRSKLEDLFGSQQRERRHGLVRVYRGGFGQRSQMSTHPTNGRRVEQVRVVVDRQTELPVYFDDHEGQIELPFLLYRKRQAFELKVAELHPRAWFPGNERRDVLLFEKLWLLVYEQHLEKRRSARISIGGRLIDQQGKRIVLMIKRFEQRVARSLQHVAKRRAHGQAQPEGQEIGEVPHDRLELGS